MSIFDDLIEERLSLDFDIKESFNEDELVLEASNINQIPELKLIKKQVQLPQGNPIGRGCVCFLYTTSFENSLKIMQDKSNFLKMGRYRYYFYPHFYQGKLFNKRYILRNLDKRKEYYKNIKTANIGVIGYPRVNINCADNKNMFYDLHQYIDIFQNICGKMPPLKYIKFYWSFFTPLFVNKPYLIKEDKSEIKNELLKELETILGSKNYQSAILPLSNIKDPKNYTKSLEVIKKSIPVNSTFHIASGAINGNEALQKANDIVEDLKNLINDSFNKNQTLMLVNIDQFNLGKDLKENLQNPLFCIYYTALRDVSLMKDANIDIYFYSNKKVLKINPSKLNEKSYMTIRNQMKLLTYGTSKSTAVNHATEENNIINDELESEPEDNILSVTRDDDKEALFDSETLLRNKLAPKSKEEKEIEQKVKTIVTKAKEGVINSIQDISDSSPVKLNQNHLQFDKLTSTTNNKTPELVNLRQKEAGEIPNESEIKKKEITDLNNEITKKAEEEINKDRELISSIYDQMMKKTPKSVASSKRDEEIRKKQKDILVGNLTIGEIEKIKANNIPIEEKDVSNVVTTLNEGLKKIKFENFEKMYNEKLLKKDITDAFLSLNGKSIPMYILKIDVKDTSDELNYKDTYTVLLEDENRKRHTIKVDIPKFLDDKFLYIGGNKKVIKHQSYFYPVVKINENTVHVVTNYSKIIIERNDKKNLIIVDRFKKLLKTFEEIKETVVFGNAHAGNKNAITTLEYDELSKFITNFNNDGYELYFSQEELKKQEGFKELPDKLCIGFHNKKPLYVDVNTQLLDNQDSIVDLMISTFKNEEIKNIYTRTKGLSQNIIAEATIMQQTIPIGVLLCYWEGLTTLLTKMKIKYRLENKNFKEFSSKENVLTFKDCVLVYDSTIPNDLILNGLKVLDTTQFNIVDLEEKESFFAYIIKKYGTQSTENALFNFYEFMIDPITKDILLDKHMPTEITELIVYAVNLLADSQFIPEINQGLSRIRSNEIIPAILYEKLAKNYVNYRNSNGKKAFSIPINCVIKEILEQKTVEDYSTLNPSLEMEICRTVSTKGFRGVNLSQAYTLEKRTYDKSMVGTIAPSTSPDGNVGVLRTLTVEPSITNLRGYVDTEKPLDELKDYNIFSPAEMTLPLAGTLDDPTRMGHAIKQSKQVIPVVNSSPVLVTNGMGEVARFHLSSDFVVNAEESGKIIDYDEKSQIMIAQYKSGKYKAIDLSSNIVKNGGGGFFLSNKLETNLKVGDTFKENQPLAWHKNFFTNSKFNNCDLNIGTLAKIAILSTYNTYEDSTFITENLAQKAATEMVFLKSVVVGRNSNVEYIVNPGEYVDIGDPLIQFDQSYDDDSLNALLVNMSQEEKTATLENAKNSIKSKYAGQIESIKVYSTITLSEMSPSLKKIVSKYYKKITDKKEFLNKYDPNDSVVKCGILINEANRPISPNQYGLLKGEYVDDGVLFEFYIKHTEPLEVGSKIANFSALKNTIGYVIPKGYEPWSEFRPDEEVSTVVASNSILARMTPSIFYTALSYKCVIELKRYLQKIWESSNEFSAKRKEMEDIIYKFFRAIDSSGANEAYYKDLISAMNDVKFKSYFNEFFRDEKAYLVVHLMEYQNKNKVTISMEEIEAAAKVIKIPLVENVAIPHLTMDKNNIVMTKEPVPVGYILIKRTQQTVLKKNGMSTEINQRNAYTGQITGKDKNGRESDIENQLFVSMGLINTMKELNSARSDDLVAKYDMLRDISVNGYVNLSDLTDDVENKTTLNLADVYFLGMGIKTDLVTPGLMTKKELRKEL